MGNHIGESLNGTFCSDYDLSNASICIISNLTKCFYPYDGFVVFRPAELIENGYIFFDIQPERPVYLSDYINFIRPDQVKDFIKENLKYIEKENTVEEKLEKLAHIVYKKIHYRWDFNNIWFPPKKA